MDAFLTDISAVQLWFTDQPVIRGAKPLEFVPSFSDARVSCEDLPWKELKVLGLKQPYHLAVPNQTRRRPSHRITCHVMRRQHPYSFVRLNKHVYAEAPIPTLIKLVPRIPLGAAVQLLYRLLGSFQIRQGDLVERRPLATLDKLTAYTENARRMKGLSTLRQLLPYAIENVASPEEGNLAALLSLPERCGGRELPLATSNARIQTAGTSVTTTRFADLLWEFYRLILEYESDAFHSSPEQLGRDSARRAQLQAAGYNVVTMTNRQLHNAAEFEDVVNTLKRFMGIEPDRSKGPVLAFTPEELTLRKALYRFDLEEALGL